METILTCDGSVTTRADEIMEEMRQRAESHLPWTIVDPLRCAALEIERLRAELAKMHAVAS